MRKLSRKVYNYVKYDLREIVWPRSLPNPPDYKPPRRLKWAEIGQAIKLGAKDYADGWRTEKPDLSQVATPKEPTFMEELAMAAKSAKGMKPVLLKIYRYQMSTYQLSIRNFIEGYREGVSEKVNLDAWLVDLASKEATAESPEKREPSSGPEYEEASSQHLASHLMTHQNKEDSSRNDRKNREEITMTDNRTSSKEYDPGYDLMSNLEIDEWNAQIMGRNSSQNSAFLEAQLSSLESFSPGSNISKVDTDQSQLQEPESPRKSETDKQMIDSEQEVKRVLEEAERLARIVMSGKFSSQEREELQRAVSKAESLMSKS